MFGDLIRRLLGGSGPPSDEAVIARDTRGLMGSLAHQVEDDPDRVLLLGSPGTPPELGEFGTVIRERPAVTEGHENLVRNLFSESGFDEIEAREIVAALIRAGAP
ncbi:MAG: hypothetical protein DCC75_11460, partial [Proteobacteria bacterium]